MAAWSDTLKAAWDDRKGPAILATVNQAGVPNIVYVGCLGRHGDDRLVIADNYFDKTRANLKAGSPGALLFMTKDGKAYQIKGAMEYHDAGPVYEEMKRWNPQKHPGHAAAVLRVEEAYSGAEKLL